MLKTEIGNIRILINGNNYDYHPIELPVKGKQFEVDKRYKIIIDNLEIYESEILVDCAIENEKSLNFESGLEPGERVALISFSFSKFKLSIGVEGDIPGINYEYMRDRLRIRISKKASVKELIIFVAWLRMSDPVMEDIYTWFAADPTLGA